MNRVWAFAANTALVFGGFSIAAEAILGHDPVTIVERACVCILIAGLSGFLFRWLLERWLQEAQIRDEALAKPAVAKTNAAPAKTPTTAGR
jgi:hypothetical protein